MKNIAIIGGSGFIGTNLISALTKQEAVVHIFDIVEPPELPANCTFTYLDIRDSQKGFDALAGFTHIYILAALLGKGCSEDNENGWKTNIAGLYNIISYLTIQPNRPLLIFTSSCMVYDVDVVQLPIKESHPLKGEGVYEIGKIYGEQLIQACCKAYGFSAVIFRFFTVFGPGPASGYKGHFIPTWIEKVIAKEPLTIHGDGSQTIDLTHVDDTVNALISVLDLNYAPSTCEVFNIATGKETSIYEIATWFKEVDPGIEFKYITANRSFAKRKVADIEKAAQAFNYKPLNTPKDGLIRLLTEKLRV